MRLVRRVFWALLAVAVPAVLLVLCFQEINLAALWARIEQASPGYLLLGLLCLAAVISTVAAEWKLLLPPGSGVSYFAVLRIVAMMVMVQNTLHHFAGHALAIYQLGVRQKLGQTVALSVLAIDQLGEGCARLALWGTLATMIDLPAWAVRGVRGILLIVGCLYAVLLVSAWTHRHRSEPVASGRGWKWVRARLADWAYNLRGIRDVRITLCVIALAIGKKLLRATAVYWVQHSLGVDLPLYAPLLVIGALDLATMVSVTPGHVGIFEATAFFTYQYLGVEPELAMSLALFDHLVFLVATVLPGLIVSVKSGYRLAAASDAEVQPRGAPHSCPRIDSPASLVES